MKSMLQPLNIAPAAMWLKNATGKRVSGALWTLETGLLQVVPGLAARDLLLVPAEHVPTLAVALPLPSHARRLAALPFAVEELVSDRIDLVHLALSTQRIGGSWLAAAVDPNRMREWITVAEEAGLGEAAMMPDALALPLPAAGRWNVLRTSDTRMLARLPDGTGFAAQEPLFLSIWTAAGKPGCDELAGFAPIVPIALDLRQGVFAPARQGLSRTARRVAAVAAAGLLAHGVIAAADTVALRSTADKRGAELITLLNSVAPGRIDATDPREAAMQAAELLPAGSSPPGSLIPLLRRASSALMPFSNVLMTRSLEFDSTQRRLLIDADLSDPEAAPGIVAALRNAGLPARFEGRSLIIGAGGAA